MSQTMPEPPARPGTDNAAGPARRAMMRWAWRLFRREWRQQLLILALITVAIAATIIGAGIASNTPPPRNATFGGANHTVVLPGKDPNLAADIAVIGSHFAQVSLGSHPNSVRNPNRGRFAPRNPAPQVIEEKDIASGSSTPITLRAESPSGSFGSSTLSLVAGSYPTGPNEVALTNQVASLYNVGIGGTWHAAGRAWNVTGLVENPDNLLDEFALVAPGQLQHPTSVYILFDAAPGAVSSYTFPEGAVVQVPPPGTSGISPAVIVLVVAIFGLLLVGMVSVAGFAVLAQRRLRAIGMISALGATDKNVRLVLAANGAVVGVLGTLAGTVVGFAAWFAYVPRLRASVGHSFDEFSLPWWTIGTTAALAILTAVYTARRPARLIEDIPVIETLSGRPASPKTARRTAIPGAILLFGGGYLLAFAGGWGATGTSNNLHLVGGLAAILIGTLLIGPFCIIVLAALASHAPIAIRLALRDLVRYRARSGAALSAISFTVVIAMLICVLAAARYSDAVDYFAPNLPSNELILYTPAGAQGAGLAKSVCNLQQSSAASMARYEATANSIASTLHSSDVLTLETASGPLLQTINRGTDVGQPYIGTPQLLEHYGISPSAVSSKAVLLTSRAGLSGTPSLQLHLGCSFSSKCPPRTCVANPNIQILSSLPADKSEPNLMLSTNTVQKYGLHVTPAAWLIQTAQPLNPAQINGTRERAAAIGMTIETKNGDPSLSELDNAATVAGILIALVVLTMTVGLVRTETSRDLRILSAAGATSTARRTITSATASALGFLGATIGTMVAYLAALTYFRSQLSLRLSHVPVLDIVLIVIGLPVVAAVGGWLLAGREPSDIAHQPIE